MDFSPTTYQARFAPKCPRSMEVGNEILLLERRTQHYWTNNDMISRHGHSFYVLCISTKSCGHRRQPSFRRTFLVVFLFHYRLHKMNSDTFLTTRLRNTLPNGNDINAIIDCTLLLNLYVLNIAFESDTVSCMRP